MYIVPKSVSGVMLSLTSANGGAAINVTWDAPVDDDVAIAHYEVMYEVSEHPSAGGTDTSTATNHLITGLEKGAQYHVWVRAVSMEGHTVQGSPSQHLLVRNDSLSTYR